MPADRPGEPGPGRQVVVIMGPIGAGKSTVAAALGERLSGAGRVVAVSDLDDVWLGLRAPGDDLERLWARARAAHAALVAGWLAAEVDVVVVHGPFLTADERGPLVAALPATVALRWVHLDVSYDVALARVAGDPSRGLSRDPAFLRSTRERHAALLHELPQDARRVDTGGASADEIADVLVREGAGQG